MERRHQKRKPNFRTQLVLKPLNPVFLGWVAVCFADFFLLVVGRGGRGRVCVWAVCEVMCRRSLKQKRPIPRGMHPQGQTFLLLLLLLRKNRLSAEKTINSVTFCVSIFSRKPTANLAIASATLPRFVLREKVRQETLVGLKAVAIITAKVETPPTHQPTHPPVHCGEVRS